MGNEGEGEGGRGEGERGDFLDLRVFEKLGGLTPCLLPFAFCILPFASLPST
jgi:hypothetical protein